MQSQGLAVPPEPLVGPGPSGPRVSTKGSCVDPSGNDPETGDSDRYDLYIEADPARLVAIGRVYEGSTVVHNTPLLLSQVKVSVEEVRDADAPVPVPTDEVSLVGQALHTFLAWPTHLVKSLSQQVAVSPPKPPPEVDDPLYLMTLTIPELFLRPYQVRWDATVFGVVNLDFPLYIKHEDLSEIAHGGQCLSISVLQLWILHLTETCMRAGNSDIYGFLEPQSIQRSGQSQFESESYIKSWMQSSQRDVYLGAYLNGGHWQMVVILPKEHLVVWFCSLHNRPVNYLKGIINSAVKGLDDAPQPKSKAPAGWIVVKCNRQKGTTELGYYVMHWMSTIILGSFRNNWEAVVVSPPKPPPKPDPEVDDPLYLMTLTIPKLFLRPYQVRWDATVFGVVNPDFPLYIKHEDLSEIAHGGQCLSISVLQLWILHLTETCMRAGNSDIYGFLEPQSIQRSGQSQFESESYIKSCMQSSQRDVYLGAYLNGPDNYLKGIINSAIKGLDDAPQPKSKAPARWIVVKCNRQKGTTECGYYVMHWMSTIILESFRNNWEAYFNDPRPLEPERLKPLRIQWAQFYLRVRDQA
ncbi:hypothetical protein GmHk_07G019713 [Glycine max]|nr:hypothetical protein GmHk_07G019713 [Glycine max]KAH1242368.1 hypothetical protein GmHk_07G019713 [Glycine max]